MPRDKESFVVFRCLNSHCRGNNGSPWKGEAVEGSLGCPKCPACKGEVASNEDTHKLQDKLTRPIVAV